MSRIEKLQIQGFRSFSPDENNPGVQKIEFLRRSGGSGNIVSPLTLILGQNGCGKTTIIECLRYVTTGDFPPGSHSGSNFVHDPKMYGETNVYANVKLQFVGNDNKRYIISRSVEASQKAKKVSIKTLDSTLTTKGMDGKSVSLSSKCFNINEGMLLRLGVSQAILSNVIFCHQEDSNWPLDEGSKVKQKFDDIFAANRYNDLLKQIKEVRSVKLAEIKNDTKDLQIYEDDMKIAKEKKKDLRSKYKTKEDIEAYMAGIKEQMEPLNLELKKIHEVERNCSGIYEKLTKAETSIKHCKSEIRDLKAHLGHNEMSGETLESLEMLKDQMFDEEKSFIEEKRELTSELHQVRGQAQRSQKLIDSIQTKLEECKTYQKLNVRNKEELKKRLRDIGAYLDWDLSNEAIFEERNLREALDNIEATRAHFEEEKAKEQRAFESALEQHQAHIGKLEIQKAQVDQRKESLMQSKIQRNKELALLKRQLSELDGYSTKLANLRQQLEAKEQELSKVESSLDPVQVAREIQEKSERVQALDKELRALRQEMSALSKDREMTAQIELKKKDLECKSASLKKIRHRCNHDLESLFQKQVPALHDLKEEFIKVDKASAQKKADLVQKRLQLRSKIDHESANLNRTSDDVKSGELRIKQFQQELGPLCTIDAFDACLESAKAKVEKCRAELQVKEANKHTFKEFVEKLGNSEICPTCSRVFDSSEECQEVIAFLKAEIESVPERVKYSQSRLEEALKLQKDLEDKLPEKTMCLGLRDDLEDKSKRLEQLQHSIGQMKTDCAQIERDLESVDESVRTCNTIREQVLQMDNLSREVKALQGSVDELEKRLGQHGLAARSYDDVKAEEEVKSQDLDRIRGDLEELRSTKVNYDGLVNRLQSEKNALFNNKLQLEKQQQERSNMEEKRSALEGQIANDNQEMAKLIEELKPLDGEIFQARQAKEKTIGGKESSLRKLEGKITHIRDKQKEVENAHNSVDKYDKSGNEEKVVEYDREVGKLRQDLSDIKSKEEDLNGKLLKVDKLINSQALRKRHLEDNIKLNRHLADETRYVDQVKALKAQLKSLNYESFNEKKQLLIEQIEQLDRESSTNKGRLAGLEDHISDLLKELDQDRIKLAGERFRKKLVQKVAREKVAKDLNTYYTALEWAILRFHKERMKVINRIAKDLWKATYKGNDIDYIEIKTDDVDVNAGADRRRSYNYRVVMVKNDTELEMRGRCSAGQKVLASLIIRLALAETFSTNCGIIALDEPTTNLDRENIESLAHALSDLVANRANSNFQLIVITHDVDLLDFLGRVDQVDHFFKVSRNEHGHSIIKKNRIDDRL